jgi:23S rRNA pseudouridine955/2504/2580 synthase
VGASFASPRHAREIALPRAGGGVLRVTAPLPDHMARTWAFFGFDPGYSGDPFGDGGGHGEGT